LPVAHGLTFFNAFQKIYAIVESLAKTRRVLGGSAQ